MAKRGSKAKSEEVIPDFNARSFWSKFVRVIGDISLVLSAIFIFLALGSDGWALFSDGSFWSVINSMWLFSFVMFYYSDRLIR